jgi:hypothetical protein
MLATHARSAPSSLVSSPPTRPRASIDVATPHLTCWQACQRKNVAATHVGYLVGAETTERMNHGSGTWLGQQRHRVGADPVSLFSLVVVQTKFEKVGDVV